MRCRAPIRRALLPAVMGLWTSSCAQIAGIEDREELAPVVLAEGEAGPRAIAVDAAGIYWIADGAGDPQKGRIRKMAKPSGPPIDLALTEPKTPLALAIDDTHVFWSTKGSGSCTSDGKRDQLLKVAKADAPRNGGEAARGTELWDRCGAALSLAVDSTLVYTTRPTLMEGFVQSFTKEDGKLKKDIHKAAESKPSGIGTTDDTVYWTDSAAGTITAYNKLSGESVELIAPKDAPDEKPTVIASDDDGIYWLAGTRALHLATTGARGAPVVLMSTLVAPSGLAVHGEHVYVSDAETGKVLKARKDVEGTVVEVATGQSGPRAIAVDDSGVYWVNDAGQIVMLKHP